MVFKKIDVGNTSIAYAKENNIIFADKTKFISVLEDALIRVPVFLRPRRFGKTYFTDLLENYYDISKAGEFDRNFEGTWIHEHKTSKANSLCCLRLDFSSVSSSPDKVEQSLTDGIATSLRIFSGRYPELGLNLPFKEEQEPLNVPPSRLMLDFLTNFSLKARKSNRKLFIIIDEYDHFANEILARDKDAFKEITSTSTEHGGLIKNFYSCLKQFFGRTESPIERFFITGVSAVSLDSLTSGFNIATNISSMPQFSSMAGFTRDELSQVIDETVDFSALHSVTKPELMDVMETYYDGYCFSKNSDERVFNPNMCLSFLKGLLIAGEIPQEMPGNSTEDISKLDGMLDLTAQENRAEISDIIFRRGSIKDQLPGVLNLNGSDLLDKDQAVWMLFYMGYITLDFSEGVAQYKCPNEITYQTFVDYLSKHHKISPSYYGANLKDALRQGNIKEIVEDVEKSIAELPSSAFSGFNERVLQLHFYYLVKRMAAGSATPVVEAETGDNGRADLYIKNATGGPDMLLELKYISKAKASDSAVATQLGAAKAQLERYAGAPKFKGIKNLKAFAIVFAGRKAVALEEVSPRHAC